MHKLLPNLIKRKTLFAAVLALTVFGAVYGFAATLNVGANTLSAGNASVASCQASGTPTGTYAVAYDTSSAAYKVSGVTVTNLDSNCAGKAISVTLTGSSGASNLGTITGTVPVGGGSLALSPSGTIAAASVTGVSVAING
jgi:Flp pilus assembly protein TadG